MRENLGEKEGNRTKFICLTTREETQQFTDNKAFKIKIIKRKSNCNLDYLRWLF